MLEFAAEMTVVLIADLQGNSIYRKRCGAQQMAGHAKAHLLNKGKQLDAALFAEQIAQVGGGKANPICKAGKRQLLVAMQRDIGLNLVQRLVKRIGKTCAKRCQRFPALLGIVFSSHKLAAETKPLWKRLNPCFYVVGLIIIH